MIPPRTFSHAPLGDDDQWQLPLGLAIGLHVLAFLLILFPPTFLFPRRDLTEVQTINLFDAGELNLPAASGPKQSSVPATKKAASPEAKKEETPPKPETKPEEPVKPPPPPEPPKPEPPKPEPVPPKPEPPPEPEVVIPPEPKVKPIPTPPEKAISLEPKKLKKKIEPEKPAPEKPAPEKAKPEKAPPEKPVAKTDDKILKSLERIQAKVNQRQENQALKDKLSRLRDSLHDIATAQPSSGETKPAATAGSGGVDAGGTASAGSGGGPSSMLDEALKKYYIAISRKIHSNWALPDTQDWDSNLEAIAVIVIRRDGSIVETFFEKKSSNIHFDQYVEKAIQAAVPMPPFPSDLNEDELEIGLKFRPSGLF